MRNILHYAAKRAASAATIAMIMLGGLTPGHAVENSVVATLVGSWSGSGRIQYTDGSSESIRCTAYYTGGGSELRMAIQCQSESNSIHMRSRLRIDGARASGDWEERTFNANGSASGRVGGSSMSLSLSGGGFTGSMSVSFSKSQHSVSISTQGIGMSKATIGFNRR
jgi:hypothetical protein